MPGGTFFRSWAACLRRVFEINPILCSVCGVEMVPVAAIGDVEELDRLLKHLGLPTDWPKTKPARAPPTAGMDSQINPASAALPPQVPGALRLAEADRWAGMDAPAPEE